MTLKRIDNVLIVVEGVSAGFQNHHAQNVLKGLEGK